MSRPTVRPAVVLLALAVATTAAAQQAPPVAPAPSDTSDQVTLKSGLVLRGEIKSAKRGELSFDSPELDVVSIDLEKMVGLVSPLFFEVALANGTVHRGSLVPAAPGSLAVHNAGVTSEVRITDVVSILRFDHGFWGRTNGSLDLGLNVTRANRLRSLLVGARMEYRDPTWGFDASTDAYWQSQEVPDTAGNVLRQETRRLALGGGASRFLGARWSIRGTGAYERNEELQLDARVQLGAQAGYDLVENQAMELSAGAGFSSNTEEYVGQSSTTSLESKITGTLDIFDLGDLDLYAAATVYRVVSEENRFRVDFDGRISWEIVNDFFVGITVTERYDSRPPLAGANKRDFQYGLSIGWSWQ